jgi:hypothetical protein
VDWRISRVAPATLKFLEVRYGLDSEMVRLFFKNRSAWKRPKASGDKPAGKKHGAGSEAAGKKRGTKRRNEHPASSGRAKCRPSRGRRSSQEHAHGAKRGARRCSASAHQIQQRLRGSCRDERRSVCLTVHRHVAQAASCQTLLTRDALVQGAQQRWHATAVADGIRGGRRRTNSEVAQRPCSCDALLRRL